MVGLGLSDITPEYRGDLRLVEQEPFSVLELQPELDSWKVERLRKQYQFLAVHAASQGRDLASPDPDHRRFALGEHKRAMLFAHLVGADAFLLHAGQIYSPGNAAGIVEDPDYRYVHSYYWEHPEQRLVRIELFLESFLRLIDFYRGHGFGFQITIENLPFPNLGATMAELVYLYSLAKLQWPLKITLDVPHLWVSCLLLKDNPWLEHFVQGYRESQKPFYSELERFVTARDDDILYYHIYGVEGLREHLPISLKTKYRVRELDLRKVAKVIGRRRPVVVEVFNFPQPVIRRSVRNFHRLLRAA